MALVDKLQKLQDDLDALSATVVEVVADIAALKLNVVDQATLDKLDAMSAKLEQATADLKAGE